MISLLVVLRVGHLKKIRRIENHFLLAVDHPEGQVRLPDPSPAVNSSFSTGKGFPVWIVWVSLVGKTV